MPIVRVDVPEGHSRSRLLDVKRRVEEAVAHTWATDHIYVAVREMIAEPGDTTAIVTVDLRPGRGEENRRASVLYREVLAALRASLGTDSDRLVMLIRQFPEESFVVSGGQRLPPLERVTPSLAD